jgi:hypothetical protein
LCYTAYEFPFSLAMGLSALDFSAELTVAAELAKKAGV